MSWTKQKWQNVQYANDHTIGSTTDWLQRDHYGTWFLQTCVNFCIEFDLDRDCHMQIL